MIRGDIRVLLSGERTALNYLQRMSGIATYTRQIADLLKDSKTKLLDTRKTTPNMRIFEYAVKVGGGYNHRYNNLRWNPAEGQPHRSCRRRKRSYPDGQRVCPLCPQIEIEVETLDMVQEAVDAGADINMLAI